MHRMLIGLALLLAGCAGGSQASGDEAAVCDSFQAMVDHLREGSGEKALATMREFQELAARSGNDVIGPGGKRLSNALNKRVGDDEVTAAQAIDEGRIALSTGGEALSRIYKECNRLGHEVDLPAYDEDGNRVPG